MIDDMQVLNEYLGKKPKKDKFKEYERTHSALDPDSSQNNINVLGIKSPSQELNVCATSMSIPVEISYDCNASIIHSFGPGERWPIGGTMKEKREFIQKDRIARLDPIDKELQKVNESIDERELETEEYNNYVLE